MSDRRFERTEHASVYAKFRPIPPQEITDKIIKYLGEKITPPYHQVLDVGCGTGQSTHIWRPYFQKLTGSDISSAQIKEAKEGNKFEDVDFIVCPSEKIPFPDNSVDLISVFTALHWFNLDEFFKEVKRLLIKNGVLAIQSYHGKVKLEFDTEEKTIQGNSLMKELFYDNLIGFQHPKTENNKNEFSSVDFPFGDVVRYSGICSIADVTVDELIGFNLSYSPYQDFKEASPEKAESSTKLLKERLLQLAGGEKETFKRIQSHYLILCRNI